MSVKTHNKTKLVPVNRSVALLPERDASISPILECIDLGVTFGGLKAVDNFDITIGRTEIAGLIGPNGAGKTTIFNLLTKVYQPTHGTILLDGKDIHGMTTAQVNRAGIARTFQNIRLFSELTVEENITVAMSSQIKYNMASGIFRLPSFWKGERIAHERAMELLSIFHMEQFANAKAGSLPYGAQRRLEIVRALATNPKVLLCDEATSALDPKTTRQILELIRDINQKLHITVVIITHQMSVVKEVCSHVAILDDGCVAESGMVGTVFAAPKSEAGRRLVFPGGADAQVYNPQDEKLVRLVFKDSKTTSIPLIARLAAEEGVFCNVISASTQKLSETVYGSMMLGIPSAQYDKAVAFIHNVANVQVEEVDHHVQ